MGNARGLEGKGGRVLESVLLVRVLVNSCDCTSEFFFPSLSLSR